MASDGVEIGQGNGLVVGPFRKSSSSPDADECVEVAPLFSGGRAVRDSKNPDGGMLLVGGTEWHAFTRAVKAGGFEL
jgi:hypothetical protein